MIRRILLTALVCLVLVFAVVFAALNPGAVTVNLGWFETTMQKSLALTLAFAFGWLFGLACLALVLLRMVLERRRLRRALRLAEGEVHALRSTPVEHAD